MGIMDYIKNIRRQNKPAASLFWAYEEVLIFILIQMLSTILFDKTGNL